MIRFRDLKPIWRVAVTFVLVVIIIIWAFFVSGCYGTVVSERVGSSVVAFDGSDQNAGVLKSWPGKGALLTARKKAEYDALVERYARGSVGHPLTPNVERGRGLTQLRGADEGFPLHEVVWMMDAEAVTYFWLFKSWERSGRIPL